jgi:amino acid transporter
MNLKEALKVASVPVIIASLCCLSPVILVLLGLSTIGFATSLSDTFYNEYKWYFRLAGLLALVVAYIYHLRRQGICTLDQAKRERNRIVNGILITLIAGVLGYFFFLYVVVEYVGKWLQIWE